MRPYLHFTRLWEFRTMTAPAKKTAPPYTTYTSFTNLISDLRATGVPTHISRSVVKGSNSGKATMISSLKAMKLINDDSTPTKALTDLVKEEDRFAENLREIVKKTYPFLFDGNVDLENTTTEVVAQQFKEAGAGGSTISKGVAFFLSAAKESGITVSPRVKAPAPARGTSATRKPKKGVQQQDTDGEDDDQEDEDILPEGMIKIPIPLHGMDDGMIVLPENLTKKQWEYAKKMAAFILDNYHQDFDDEGSTS